MPIFRVRDGFTVAGRYVSGELIEMSPAQAATAAHMIEPVDIETFDGPRPSVSPYRPPARNTVIVRGAP